MTDDDLDRSVRLHIYEQVVDHGVAPGATETAIALGLSPLLVEESYRRLAAGRVIVLEPGTLDIRMANPFAAAPTPFRVHTARGAWWGNCLWDALGIIAALRTDGRVATSCPDCATPLEVSVEAGIVSAGDGVFHVAVPAMRWWEDIVFT